MQTPEGRHPGYVTCDACWEANPLPHVDIQTHVKTLACPQTSLSGDNKNGPEVKKKVHGPNYRNGSADLRPFPRSLLKY